MNSSCSIAENIQWQPISVSRHDRFQLKKHKPCCVWLTGLSGAGKSTIANLLELQLHASGIHTYVLDGDNLRHGLNSGLGFSAEDRSENVRRVGEVAHLMLDAGLLVIVALISPSSVQRSSVRKKFAAGEFVEVFVDTSLQVCEQRDVKGLYAKSRRGEIKNLTGIGSAYESPESPEIHLHAEKMTPDQCVQIIIDFIYKNNLLI